MLNLGLINFDNTGLAPNTIPKVTAPGAVQTLSPSKLTDDGTTLRYKGVPVVGSGTPGGSNGEIQYNNGGAFGGAGLTDGEHFAMGVGAVVDSVPGATADLFGFFSPTDAILVDKETSITADGTNGIYSEVDWSPTTDVPTTDYRPFAIGAVVSVNADGQSNPPRVIGLFASVAANGDTTPMDTDDGLVAGVFNASVNGNASSTDSALRGVTAYIGNYSASGKVGDATGYASTFEQDNAGASTDDYLAFVTTLQMFGGSLGSYIGFLFDTGDSAFDGGTIGRVVGFEFDTPTLAGTVVTDMYGVYISDVVGATNNWAIKTGLGLVEFGGAVKCDKTIRAGTVYSAAGTPLPSAVTEGVGARAFVSDAVANTFNAPYAGSGTNKVPVFSDGANWFIG